KDANRQAPIRARLTSTVGASNFRDNRRVNTRRLARKNAAGCRGGRRGVHYKAARGKRKNPRRHRRGCGEGGLIERISWADGAAGHPSRALLRKTRAGGGAARD